ncbi:MAG: (d)CMP kinase [Planctomycetes bacterium]|nr:(d)CMP kinase [Planctomycetota bacterium]
MIVTIDGPAGAGKSSAARELAGRLGFDFLDTGAMYRAVTLAGLRSGCDLADIMAVRPLLAGMNLEMPGNKVILDGEDISEAIRKPEVTAASGATASNLTVRAHLVEQQRRLAHGRNIVCEGRDQGTVVFPDARCKFFLSADPVERARRRQRELQERGEHLEADAVLQAQEERDRRDSARAVGPMVPAADAVLLDSTHMSLDQVVSAMEQIVRNRMQIADDA